jgi:CRP/FNR family transcriptional regulator
LDAGSRGSQQEGPVKPLVENEPATSPGLLPFGPPILIPRDDSEEPADAHRGGRELHFAPRSLIFMEGAEIESVFQIVEGAVMLYKLLPDGRRQVVEVLGAGDVFGFSPLPVRDCSAETLKATHCVAFNRDVVERSPSLVRKLSAHLYSQLCALHEHVMLLGRKSAMERMTSFLMRCVPGRGVHGCPGPGNGADHARVRLTMTRQEIADYLGLTIETVSRSLTKLKRRGVVSIGKLDEIDIHDVCRLCQLSGTHLTRGRSCSAHMERAAWSRAHAE